MSIFRVIAIAFLLWVAYVVIKAFWARTRVRATPKPVPVPAVGKVLKCCHCGTHVPQQHALIFRGLPYCCNEHIPS